MACGAGCAFGPLLGSVVYIFFNYIDTFYFFTVYVVIFGLGAVFMIPSRINNQFEVQETNILANENGDNCDINYGKILKNIGTITSLGGCTMAMLCIYSMDPTLAVRLIDLGMEEKYVGVVFASMGLSYGLGAACCGWICNKISKIVVM